MIFTAKVVFMGRSWRTTVYIHHVAHCGCVMLLYYCTLYVYENVILQLYDLHPAQLSLGAYAQ